MSFTGTWSPKGWEPLTAIAYRAVLYRTEQYCTVQYQTVRETTPYSRTIVMHKIKFPNYLTNCEGTLYVHYFFASICLLVFLNFSFTQMFAMHFKDIDLCLKWYFFYLIKSIFFTLKKKFFNIVRLQFQIYLFFEFRQTFFEPKQKFFTTKRYWHKDNFITQQLHNLICYKFMPIWL